MVSITKHCHLLCWRWNWYLWCGDQRSDNVVIDRQSKKGTLVVCYDLLLKSFARFYLVVFVCYYLYIWSGFVIDCVHQQIMLLLTGKARKRLGFLLLFFHKTRSLIDHLFVQEVFKLVFFLFFLLTFFVNFFVNSHNDFHKTDYHHHKAFRCNTWSRAITSNLHLD